MYCSYFFYPVNSYDLEWELVVDTNRCTDLFSCGGVLIQFLTYLKHYCCFVWLIKQNGRFETYQFEFFLVHLFFFIILVNSFGRIANILAKLTYIPSQEYNQLKPLTPQYSIFSSMVEDLVHVQEDCIGMFSSFLIAQSLRHMQYCIGSCVLEIQTVWTRTRICISENSSRFCVPRSNMIPQTRGRLSSIISQSHLEEMLAHQYETF